MNGLDKQISYITDTKLAIEIGLSDPKSGNLLPINEYDMECLGEVLESLHRLKNLEK